MMKLTRIPASKRRSASKYILLTIPVIFLIFILSRGKPVSEPSKSREFAHTPSGGLKSTSSSAAKGKPAGDGSLHADTGASKPKTTSTSPDNDYEEDDDTAAAAAVNKSKSGGDASDKKGAKVRDVDLDDDDDMEDDDYNRPASKEKKTSASTKPAKPVKEMDLDRDDDEELDDDDDDVPRLPAPLHKKSRFEQHKKVSDEYVDYEDHNSSKKEEEGEDYGDTKSGAAAEDDDYDMELKKRPSSSRHKAKNDDYLLAEEGGEKEEDDYEAEVDADEAAEQAEDVAGLMDETEDGAEDEEERGSGIGVGGANAASSSSATFKAAPSPAVVDRVFGIRQDEDVNDVLEWMRNCKTLSCIIKANDRLQGRTRFNFPHYFLVGWQKCATTSVNAYLRHHPQYLPGIKKEPHWFSVCQNNLDAPHCLVKNESQYLQEFLRLNEAVDSRLEMVTLDASADYAQKGGPLARRLYRLFPWLKVVIMVREPISRLISYTRMHTQSTFQQWKACPKANSLFMCLRPHLMPGALNSNYSHPLQGWLQTFPTEQIHVIQFEELQEAPERVLYELKSFLGMDVDLPERPMSNVNSRRAGTGYNMRRGQYMKLVRMVRSDAERTADLLDRYGLADKAAWMARWEAVWNDFLNRCPEGATNCLLDSN